MYQVNLGASVALTDDEFVEAFEGLTLPASGFSHADHVRLAWIYLVREDLIGALQACRDGIKRFAVHHGATNKYHETLTCAAVVLINERMHRTGPGNDWADFAASHPDLLQWKGGAFFEHYPPEVVHSREARRVFMLPRRRDASVSEQSDPVSRGPERPATQRDGS